MAGMKVNEVRELAKDLEKQGAVLIYKKDGIMVRLPDKSVQMLHFTNSDRRAYLNVRAAVKRAGLSWPGDHTDHGKKKKPGSKPATLKAIRKAFLENDYKPMKLQEIVAATGLTQPTISRAAASGELERVSRGVWKWPNMVPTPPPARPVPVSETPPEPPEVLVQKLKITNEEIQAEVEDVLDDIQRHIDLHKPTVDFIDDRDSWTVDLHPLPPTMTIKDLFDAYVAAGLGFEIRVWKADRK